MGLSIASSRLREYQVSSRNNSKKKVSDSPKHDESGSRLIKSNQKRVILAHIYFTPFLISYFLASSSFSLEHTF